MIAQNENEEQKSELSADQKLIEQLQKEIQALKDSKTQELHLLNEEYKELEESYFAIKNANIDLESQFKDEGRKFLNLKMFVRGVGDAVAYEKEEGKDESVSDFMLEQLLNYVKKTTLSSERI